jgi:tRNA uridine 5-carboxymethylaminomethyl modification enzyme
VVGDAQWEAFERKRDAVAAELERLKSTWVNPRILAAAESERVIGQAIEREYSLADLLRRPNVDYDTLVTLTGLEGQSLGGPGVTDPAVQEQVEIQLKYSGYIERQLKEVERHEHYENLKLPEGFNYLDIAALSVEVRQKLDKHRPETLGQASRISGVTPAAISLLLVHLKKTGFGGFVTLKDEAA